MVKKILIIIFIIFSTSIYAEIIPLIYEPGPVEYELLINNNLKEIPVRDNVNQSYNVAYRDITDSYEIRYITFRQNQENISEDDIRFHAATFANLVLLNIASSEDRILSATQYEDSDVQAEFNGDFGYTCVISESYNEFCEGFKYLNVNFYIKKNLGMVSQVILFNDLNIFKSTNFIDDFHSFRFK